MSPLSITGETTIREWLTISATAAMLAQGCFKLFAKCLQINMIGITIIVITTAVEFTQVVMSQMTESPCQREGKDVDTAQFETARAEQAAETGERKKEEEAAGAGNDTMIGKEKNGWQSK